ncbi:MAG: methyltransferase domain-containing protein, partial [Brachymonas sp.]|nr:methyltransferase domain-containing protein [Brachymonas sp.]
GVHLREWEQARCDHAVGDCFGYHAVQVGAPFLPLLRSSRIQHRWTAAVEFPGTAAANGNGVAPPDLALEPAALPFTESSIDLLLLAHALEASADPHAALREAARVLVPEGHLVLLGFNPGSLWGFQQRRRLLAQRMGGHVPPFIPDVDDFIPYQRLYDWLNLLGFEIDAGCFGCYRPGVRSPQAFERLRWMEAAGDRWWPFMGGVYFLQATKRVRGLRLIQPRWKTEKEARSAVAALQRNSTTLPAQDTIHTACKK